MKELIDSMEDMIRMGTGENNSNRNLLNLKVNLKDVEPHSFLIGWHGFCLIRNGKVAFGGIYNG